MVWCNKLLLFPILMFLSYSLMAQVNVDMDMDDDDLSVGGDIFSDFNEDLENTQILEDERFFKYGRFYSFQIGVGLTTFTGNRGLAYQDQHPSFTLGLNYFLNFQSSFGIGMGYSRHNFFLAEGVQGYQGDDPKLGAGFVEVNMLRMYLSYRYYIDTSDLGTAITYSNPYIITRFEYWYMTNKFIDQKDYEDESGGGIGFALGGGFEFPIVMKESYIGVEFLWHTVNLPDKNTQEYRPLEGQTFGYEDFSGDALTVMVTYVMSW